MSGTFIVGICGVVATIIVPSALFFVARLLDRRSLQVSLIVCDAPLPLAVNAFLRDQLNMQYPSVGVPTASLPLSRPQLEFISDIRGYMKLTLHNPTSKKLTALTVVIRYGIGNLYKFLYQTDDEPTLRGPTELKIVLGDLQPHQSRSLHVWADVPYPNFYFKNLQPIFDVTADEYDKRPMRFPFPNYLKTYVNYRASRYALWISLTFLLFETAH